MEDVDESSSKHDIRDFPSSPHLFNKKAYRLKIFKDANNIYSARLGFIMFQLPLFPPFALNYFQLQ